MRIIFMGSGVFAEPTLRWLAQSGHEVPLVVSQPARSKGRGQRKLRTPVGAVATELGFEVLEAEDINDDASVAALAACKADLCLVIAFGQKLGPRVIGMTSGGCLNLHASLLPKYRGAAPINWAIIHGEERTGCTVFRIDQRMDTGRVLCSRWTAIKPDETAGELHDRLAGVGVDAVQAALAMFADGAIPEGEPQDDAQATKAPKLSKEDGKITFDAPAREIAGRICGLTPWPGVTVRFHADDGRWETVQLLRARVAETAEGASPSLEPGTIDERRYVAAADGFVQILEVKPSSGRIMSWQDYVNGRHVAAGDRFASARD